MIYSWNEPIEKIGPPQPPQPPYPPTNHMQLANFHNFHPILTKLGRVGSAISERLVIRNTLSRRNFEQHFLADDDRSKKIFHAVMKHDTQANKWPEQPSPALSLAAVAADLILI